MTRKLTKSAATRTPADRAVERNSPNDWRRCSGECCSHSARDEKRKRFNRTNRKGFLMSSLSPFFVPVFPCPRFSLSPFFPVPVFPCPRFSLSPFFPVPVFPIIKRCRRRRPCCTPRRKQQAARRRRSDARYFADAEDSAIILSVLISTIFTPYMSAELELPFIQLIAYFGDRRPV